jgi:hypothetical protein
MGLWFSGFWGRRGLARLKRLIRNQQFMGSNPIGGFYSSFPKKVP